MDKYRIEFGYWDPGNPLDDVADIAVLYVHTANMRFPFRIQMSGSLHATLQSNQAKSFLPEQLRRRMLHVALPKLVLKFNSLETPRVSTNGFILTESFSSDDIELFKTDPLVKNCQYQEYGIGGLMCHAAASNDKLNGKTSSAVCATCDLPDNILRCTNLKHPETVGIYTDMGCHGRHVVSTFCDIKTTTFDHKKCIPGGNRCWRQEFDNTSPIPEIAEDIAERTVDELQYMNLGFHHAFDHSPLRINDPRLITQILTQCNSQEEFAAKVACIADILNNLDLKKWESEINSQTHGTLNRLEDFLKRKKVLVDEKPIRTLRSIVSLRNSFPIHSGNTAFLKACEELGAKYPPDSWQKAWDITLYNAWKSFRTLRTILPS